MEKDPENKAPVGRPKLYGSRRFLKLADAQDADLKAWAAEAGLDVSEAIRLAIARLVKTDPEKAKN